MAKDPGPSGAAPEKPTFGGAPSEKPILVLGVGNLLLKDEGVGIHVVRSLAAQELPPDVEVMDGGTRGLDLLMLFQGRRLVIIVDCARMGEKPGAMRVFEARDLPPQQGRAFSVHGINLGDALELGERLGMLPEVVIVGVEPEKIDIEIGLTDAVKAIVPKIEKTVRELIQARR